MCAYSCDVPAFCAPTITVVGKCRTRCVASRQEPASESITRSNGNFQTRNAGADCSSPISASLIWFAIQRALKMTNDQVPMTNKAAVGHLGLVIGVAAL